MCTSIVRGTSLRAAFELTTSLHFLSVSSEWWSAKITLVFKLETHFCNARIFLMNFDKNKKKKNGIQTRNRLKWISNINHLSSIRKKILLIFSMTVLMTKLFRFDLIKIFSSKNKTRQATVWPNAAYFVVTNIHWHTPAFLSQWRAVKWDCLIAGGLIKVPVKVGHFRGKKERVGMKLVKYLNKGMLLN